MKSFSVFMILGFSVFSINAFAIGINCSQSYHKLSVQNSNSVEKQTLQDLARLFIDWQSQEPGSGKWLSLKDKYEQVRDQIQWNPENSKDFYDTIQTLNGKKLQEDNERIVKTEKQKKDMDTEIEQTKLLNEFLNKYNLKDLNDSDIDGYTALHLAAAGGHKVIVELLLKDPRFTVINKANNYGSTALYWAARNGHKEIVEILLKDPRFTAINKANIFGETALPWAARNGHKDIADILLKVPRFTAINSADNFGFTALHLAARNEHKDIVELLLNDPRFTAINTVNNVGFTALHLAAQSGHKDIVELLKKYGAKE